MIRSGERATLSSSRTRSSYVNDSSQVEHGVLTETRSKKVRLGSSGIEGVEPELAADMFFRCSP